MATAIDSLPGIFYVIDIQGRFLLWNSNFERVSGYSAEEIGAMHPLDFFVGDDKRVIAERIQAVFETGDSSTEAVLVAKDGKRTPYFFTGKRTQFQGAPCLVGMGIDISTQTKLYEQAQAEIAAHMRTEAALRRSEAQYRQFTEAMPQLAWITDVDGVPEYFNQGWYSYTGTTLEIMLDPNRPHVIHPDEQERARTAWKQAVQSGRPYHVEYRLRSAEGTYLWFLARGVPIKDAGGQITHWLGTCTEIDAQKRAAEKERFLAETSNTLASTLDYETTLTTVARLAVPHLADWCSVYVVDSRLRLRLLVLAHADPEKAKWAQEMRARYPFDPSAKRGIANVLRTGQSELFPDIAEELSSSPEWGSGQVRYLRALGVTSMMVVPILAQGRMLGVLLFASAEAGCSYGPADLAVAEDVAARAALAMENARLFTAEKERSEQLSVAIMEVHHRVKNNLQSVAALLELQIPDEGGLVTVDAVYNSLNQIKTIALVHDLLARDRIGVVNIAQVFSKLAGLLSSSMGTRARRLPIQVEAQSIEMATKSATSLALAVNELLTNAAKHSDIEEKSAIHLWLNRDDRIVHVTVEDNGPGFARGFDPSQQAGIGLNLVLTLIQHELRGSVRFSNVMESETAGGQRGARVEISFPVSSLEE
ncbi:MAG: Phytochrome, two-component sensor histidine kinase [Chthonomonadaceae bacterium]|nr:Phytochrome, two-component sensor histidine kinase [Chthonomonadaceae bacterium]